MPAIRRSERTTLRRKPERGSHERGLIERILDEGVFCHVGFVVDGQPYVIPTIHARLGEHIYIHGSAASRMLRTLRDGLPVCLTVTLLDGLVLARSAFHHSVNYRSVVLLGAATEVTAPDEKLAAAQAIVEHVVPHRWNDVRSPTDRELKATRILRLPIEEASAKIRSGPPIDDEEDLALSCWAGEIPLRLTQEQPVPAPELGAGVEPPNYVTRYGRSDPCVKR